MPPAQPQAKRSPAVPHGRRLAALSLLFLGLCRLTAAETATSADSLLVFKDGERIRGHIIGREPGVLIVETARFGVQRIAVGDLENAPAEPSKASVNHEANATTQPPGPPGDASSLGRAHALLERLRRHLRFWHAGINVALEAKQEDIQRSSVLVELKASHEFSADEVHGSMSYERVHENQRLTTDIAKGEAYWRHDLSPRWFSVYLSNMEWNRHYVYRDLPIRYLLTQQEAGFGRTFLRSDRMKLRAGVAENFLNLWILNYSGQASTTIESLFAEADLKLPYDIQFTQRISYYYAIRNGEQGQKSEFELTKRLTEHFNIRLRHEYRRNLPLSNVNDINLWRLVFGLEY